MLYVLPIHWNIMFWVHEVRPGALINIFVLGCSSKGASYDIIISTPIEQRDTIAIVAKKWGILEVSLRVHSIPIDL